MMQPQRPQAGSCLEVLLSGWNRQHQKIVDAILRGDAEEASRAVQDHLEGTAALLHGFPGSPDVPPKNTPQLR